MDRSCTSAQPGKLRVKTFLGPFSDMVTAVDSFELGLSSLVADRHV